MSELLTFYYEKVFSVKKKTFQMRIQNQVSENG